MIRTDILMRLCARSDGIEVRPATKRDAASVAMGCVVAGVEIPPDARALVAVVDGKVVGQVLLRLTGSGISAAGLWVSPAFRAKPVALALVCAIAKLAADQGINVHWHVEDHRHAALYRRMGAKRKGMGYVI